MVMALFKRGSDAPIDQAATCDLKKASESSFRTTCSTSSRLATGTGMRAIREVCGTFFRRARSPKMIDIGATFEM